MVYTLQPGFWHLKLPLIDIGKVGCRKNVLAVCDFSLEFTYVLDGKDPPTTVAYWKMLL